MSYNWKCCSFYPNNFGASALTSVGIHVYLGRGTCVPRSGYDDFKGIFNGKTVISPPRPMHHIVFSKNIFTLFS